MFRPGKNYDRSLAAYSTVVSGRRAMLFRLGDDHLDDSHGHQRYRCGWRWHYARISHQAGDRYGRRCGDSDGYRQHGRRTFASWLGGGVGGGRSIGIIGVGARHWP